MPTILQRNVPVVLPKYFRRTRAYRIYHAQIAQATTFKDIIERLEAQLQSPTGRIFLAADFDPQAHYAQKFLRTTALSAQKNPDMAKRALKILTHLWTDTADQRGRRATVQSLTQSEAARIIEVRQAWARIVGPIWKAVWPDKRALLKALEASASLFPGYTWTDAHASQLRALLGRPTMRPVYLVVQLTAWTLRMPIRRVRSARPDGDYDDDVISV